MDKDYSLLRPFDLQQAKDGESVTNLDESVDWKFVAGPDSDAKIVFYWTLNPINDEFFAGKYTNPINPSLLRMAPLTWVAGRPVYKGDELYGIHNNHKYTATPDWWIPTDEKKYTPMPFSVCDMTWTPPKVKRKAWVNVYKGSTMLFMYLTEDAAKGSALDRHGKTAQDYVATIRIEWEEPAC